MADETIKSTEQMVGSGHGSKADTLNRHGLVEHETDGTHAVVTATSLRTDKGADVASATALPILTDGNYFDVTGTTTVTSINTVGIGTVIKLHFDGILILTHHATDLVLPDGANITTAAGDELEFTEYATGDWRCTNVLYATTPAAVSTKEFFIPTKGTSVVGSFSVNDMGAANDEQFNFIMPTDFTTLTSAVVVVIPDTTETIQWDIDTNYAATGEAYTTHTGQALDESLAVTINIVTELDISGVLSSVAASDYVGANFQSDTSNIRVMGIRIKYS